MPSIKSVAKHLVSSLTSISSRGVVKYLPLAALCLLLVYLALDRILTAGIPWTPDDTSFVLRVDYIARYGLTPWSHWWYGGFPLFTYNGPLPIVIPWLFIEIFHTDTILGYKIAEALFFIAAPLCLYFTARKYHLTAKQATLAAFIFALGPSFLFAYLAHGQLAQLVALPFMLLAMGFFHDVITRRQHLVPAALFTALTIFSHHLTALVLVLFVIFDFLFVALILKRKEKVLELHLPPLWSLVKTGIYATIPCLFFLVPLMMSFTQGAEAAVEDYAGFAGSYFVLYNTLGIFSAVFILLVTPDLSRRRGVATRPMLVMFYATFFIAMGLVNPLFHLIPLSSILPGERFFLYASIAAALVIGQIIGEKRKLWLVILMSLFLLSSAYPYYQLTTTHKRDIGYPTVEVTNYLNTKSENAKILTFDNSPIWAYDLPMFTGKALIDGWEPVSRLGPNHVYYYEKNLRLITHLPYVIEHYLTFMDDYGAGWILIPYIPEDYQQILDQTKSSTTEEVDASQTYGPVGGDMVYGTNTQGQVWTTRPGVHDLTKVILHIQKHGNPINPAVLSVYDSTDKTKLLGSATKDAQDIGSWGFHEFEFNITLEPSHSYYMELSTDGGNPENWYEWSKSDVDLYHGGDSYYRDRRDSSKDQNFQTFFTTSSLQRDSSKDQSFQTFYNNTTHAPLKVVLESREGESIAPFALKKIPGYILLEATDIPSFIDAAGPAIDVSYTRSPTEITISASVGQAGTYVFDVKDILTEDWLATIDNRAVALEANHLGLIHFEAELAEGEHIITICYHDKLFVPLLLVSGAGTAAIALYEAVLFIVRRRRRNAG